jgi:hypothetical protein
MRLAAALIAAIVPAKRADSKVDEWIILKGKSAQHVTLFELSCRHRMIGLDKVSNL